MPHSSFVAGPSTVTDSEVHGKTACSFVNEHSQPSISCTLEKDTSADSVAYVRNGSTILEVGARYGSVSCQLAALTANSGRVVAVEPDSSVWPALTANLASHNCSVRLLQGAIADAPLHITRSESPYATNTNGGSDTALQASGKSDASSTPASTTTSTVPAISFDDLLTVSGLKFDTLVVDCEGCLPTMLKSERRDSESIIRTNRGAATV